MNDYIDKKLAEIEEIEERSKEMPCGDEMAKTVTLIERARKEVIYIESHSEKGKHTKLNKDLIT